MQSLCKVFFTKYEVCGQAEERVGVGEVVGIDDHTSWFRFPSNGAIRDAKCYSL
jgi:hypothetical protein